jgi:RNA polymerase sigma-70 factor (ECF subfamily)
MAPRTGQRDCESVLSELPWLRRLAKSLGASEDLAEDLTQSTVLSALEHPPDASRPVKGWLRTVLRNLFQETRRRRLRRELREAHAARPEAGDVRVDVVARAAVQKQVVDAVMALDEPYRTTVLLRFFEDLPPRRIAARLGVPVATVKTRLARALATLRGRMDREHGGSSAWLLGMLAPLPKLAAGGGSLIGVTLVQAKLKLSLVAAALMLGAAGWLTFDRLRDDRPAITLPAGGPVSDPAPAKAPAPDALIGGSLRPRPIGADADSVPTAPEAADPGRAAAALEKPAAARVRGRVIDTRSTPVAGMRVVFRESKAREGAPESAPAHLPAGTSGEDGVFEMDPPAASGTLHVQNATHATVLSGAYEPHAAAVEPLIVVAQSRAIAGRVVDEDKRPLAGARVWIELPEDFRARFDRVLDYSQTGRWSQKTDAEGAFALDSAPGVDGATLGVHLDGYEDRTEAAPPVNRSDLEIVLRRTAPKRDTITGSVVDHQGAAVPDARVAIHDRTTRTDPKGQFTIKIDPKAPPGAVIALKEGLLPATLKLAKGSVPSTPLVLKLDGSPLSITGKVVDQKSKPLAGIQVWTADPTFFASTRGDGIQFVENLVGGAGLGFWRPVKTDDEGRFTLKGLLPRDYRIHSMDPKTLALVDAGAVAAGSTGVVITMGGAVHEKIAGVVVSLGGSPVPGVKVKPQRDTFTFKVTEGGRSTSHADVDGVVTDAQGRFALHGVPADGVYLRLDGAGILPREYGRGSSVVEEAKGQPVEALRIEVSVRCHLQIDLSAQPDLADAVSILDESGNPRAIDIFIGSGRKTVDWAEITEGKTSVLAVPENTATVILKKGKQEVDRRRVKLVPGKVTTITP